MKILDYLFRPKAQATPPPRDDFWYGPADRPSTAGVSVTPDSAMRVSAVFACVRVKSETIASLPCLTYNRLPNGGKERATENPLFTLLKERPNRWQTAFEFWEMLGGHEELRGNAYAEIVRSPRDLGITDLVPLHPDRMKVERLENGRLQYRYRPPITAIETVYSQDQIFHIRGLSSDGMTGLSPIDLMRESVGLTMAAETHGAAFFGNGARPGMLLKHPGKMKKESAENLERKWNAIHQGPYNSYKTAVLEEGMDVAVLGVDNRQSQFMDLRKFQIGDIARIFRVPPHMIGDLDKATFSNIENQSIAFVVHCIRPLARRIEAAIQRSLIGEDENVFAEFLLDGLLRGDIASRYAAFAVGRQNGWLSVNDIRGIENMNPVEGGDVYLVQQNMVPASRLDEIVDAQIKSSKTVTQPPQKPETPAPAGDTRRTEDAIPVIEATATAGIQEIVNDIVDGEEHEPGGEATEQSCGGDSEETAFSSAAMSVLINDASERIANAELNGLERRVDKAIEDRARFNAWMNRFHAGQASYVIKTITPVVTVAMINRGNGTERAQVDSISSKIVRRAEEAMLQGDNAAANFVILKETYSACVAGILKKELCGDG